MKKNYIIRIAALVLMCALVTSCFASSTFAKYTASATGNAASVTVAKWSIKAGKDATNAVEIAGVTSAKFDIAKTVTNAVNDEICPGSSGSFSFVIKNDSDVAANYTVTLDKTGLGALADVITVTDPTLTGTLAAGESKTITTTWSWPYSNSKDAADTALGTAAGTFTFGASIAVEQATNKPA